MRGGQRTLTSFGWLYSVMRQLSRWVTMCSLLRGSCFQFCSFYVSGTLGVNGKWLQVSQVVSGWCCTLMIRQYHAILTLASPFFLLFLFSWSGSVRKMMRRMEAILKTFFWDFYKRWKSNKWCYSVMRCTNNLYDTTHTALSFLYSQSRAPCYKPACRILPYLRSAWHQCCRLFYFFP